MLLKDIPGLQRAVGKAASIEARTRRRSFFPSSFIGRIPVLPFTPRHFMLLDEAQNPFLAGGHAILAEHVAQFLWIVSPHFRLPGPLLTLGEVRAARRKFIQSIANAKFGPTLAGIGRYLEEALFDAPKKSGPHPDLPIASLGAALIDEFASAYHWLPQVLDAQGQPLPGAGILDMPFSWLLQFRRLIRQRFEDAAIENPLSDDVKRRKVREHFAKKKKVRKRK